MIIKVQNETPFQVLTGAFSIGPSETGYELQVGATPQDFATLFSVGANTTRMVTNVANGSYYRLKNNVGEVKVNWSRTCVTNGGGSGSGTELTPVAEFPLGAAEGTVVALASGDTVGLYQFIDGEWVLVGADDPTKLLAVNELPASAEPGTVMALYQEGEAGGGTWEWDEASEEYVFNCNFSTLDTAATYDLGSPLGGDVSGCYNYGNINLHYDNGWKVTTSLNICGVETDKQSCENQGGTWICGEEGDCNCSLYRTIELSPSTDPNNGFGSGDMCYDEETERNISQRFYWDPADLKLKYVMIDDNDEVTHYRYDCSGVPDLRNIAGATEPILAIYQYDGQNWNEVGGVDLSAYWTSAQTKDYVDSGFWTSAQTKTYVDSGFWTSAQTKTYVDSAVSGIDLSNYYTKAETDSAITAVEDHIYDVEKVAASALTELHADISEFQEQIDTMDEVVSEALVDLNERIGEISGSSVDLSGYYTSGETDAAISAATAGKADAANMYIPQHTRIPKWNTQGIITGTTGYDYFNKDNTINGIAYTALQTNNQTYSIYAPTTPGTAGQILVSSGNRTPVWSAMTFPTPDVDKAYVDSAITEVQEQIDTMDEVVSEALVDLNTRKVESSSVSTIWKGTQAEYDAIVTKDASTLYIIVNNS